VNGVGLIRSRRGNLSTHLHAQKLGDTISILFGIRAGKKTLENLYCLRCNQELEVGHRSVSVYMFAQTVGVRPRQKSAAQRICFCPKCSVSLAMGPAPEGALNIAAWNMIREVVGADPSLSQSAWETLRGLIGLLPAGENDSGSRPTGTGGYFEF
jgi:hypothetical protein